MLTTGCDAVDDLLLGGFPPGIVSELCGVAGSGKTQLALQLLLRAQLPTDQGGLDGRSCYMYTDSLSPLKRLNELAQNYKNDEVSLDKIFLEIATDPMQLLNALKTRLPTLLDRHKVRLVVIDAITAVFRGIAVDSAADAGDRSKIMFEMVNCMRILAAQYDVVFVVINQMTTNMTVGIVPALGLAWSTCVNQRFQLAKVKNPSFRSFKTIFSPYLPSEKSALFEITASKLQ
ncbi:DNA repair protein XRCC3 [Thraustotheca clavata]|uniref:DNA repair protein XRCC3 n=1 Tax=Thraustotheca clavata TaxID=74557 RepID=A0A1V9Z9W5_9STRA|nr:DNA repair protein XRCC3 [Thraustotheca clavata]